MSLPLPDDSGPIDLSLGGAAGPEEPIDLSMPKPEMSLDLAEKKAAKAHFGLGDLSPGMDSLKFGMAAGLEDSIRSNATSQLRAREAQIRSDQAKNFILSKPPGGVSKEDLDYIYGLTDPKEIDKKVTPTDVLERAYAERMVKTATADMVAGVTKDTRPEVVKEIQNEGTDLTTASERARHHAEMLRAQVQTMGWGEYAMDLAGNFIPGRSHYNRTNVMSDAFKKNWFWLGNNMDEQARAYYAEKDPERRERMLTDAINSIKEHNLLDAAEYAEYIANATSGSKDWANAMSLIQPLWIGGAIWGGLRATMMLAQGGKSAALPALKQVMPITGSIVGRLSGATKAAQEAKLGIEALKAQELAKATEDVVKAATNPAAKVEDVIEAAGDIARSADIYAVKAMEARAANTGRATVLDDLKGQIMSTMNPGYSQGIPTAGISAERALRINSFREKLASDLQERVFVKPINIDRLKTGSEAEAAATKSTLDKFLKQENSLSRAVINLEPRYATPEDIALASIKKEHEIRMTQLMQDLKLRGKQDEFLQFTRDADDYERALRDYENLTDNIIPLHNPYARTEKLSNKRLSQVLKGLKEEPDVVAGVDPVAKQAALDKIDFHWKKIQDIPERDRKLYQNAMRTTENVAHMPVEKISPPNVRLVKDELSNNKYLGIKLGASAEAAVAKGFRGNLYDIDSKMAIQLGKTHDALPFESAEQADFWARNVYGLPEYSVRQHGASWVLEVLKSIDETAASVREQLAIDTNGSTPKLNFGFWGHVRGASFNMSEDLQTSRKITAYGTSAVQQALADAYAPINALRKDSRKDFMKYLLHERDMHAPGQELGAWSSDSNQFAKRWRELHNRLPTEQEEQAYWSHTIISDTSFAGTNMRLLTGKTRAGGQLHDFGSFDGNKFFKPQFEGKFIDHLPELDHDAGFLIVDRNSKAFEYIRRYSGKKVTDEGPYLKQKLGSTNEDPKFFKGMPKDFEKQSTQMNAEKNAAYLNDHIKGGYKLVHITSYAEEDMRKAYAKAGVGLPEGRIEYVLTKELSSTPLNYHQIPFRGGGPQTYDVEFKISQPKIEHTAQRGRPETRYYGDTVIHGFTSDKNMKALAKAEMHNKSYNEAADLYLAVQEGREQRNVFDNFIKKNLPFSPKEAWAKFESGYFDPHVPFVVTPFNQTIDKAHNIDNLLRLIKHDDIAFTGSQLKNTRFGPVKKVSDYYADFNLDLKNAMERGDTLTSIANSGTKENPIFKVEAAKTLDPLSAVERQTSEVIRGRYIEDLKFQQAENFVAEFGKFMNATPEELHSNPLKYLYEPNFKPNIKQDRDIYLAAVAQRRTALEFLHIRSEAEKDMNWMKALGMKHLLGDGSKVAEVIDPWLEGASHSSIIQKAKNAVFTMKMSIGSLKQFFIQGQSAISVSLIDGNPARAVRSFSAVSASTFAKFYGRTEEDLRHIAKALEGEHGWKADHFVEAYQALERTGFNKVGRERIDMDDFMTSRFLTTRGLTKNFIDWSTVPVTTGDKAVRHHAWYTAYDAWRSANPTAKFDDNAVAAVLDRADTLAINPSSASASSVQKADATTLMFQFKGYNMRLWEKLMTKELSDAERIRLGIGTALMYGVPVQLGAMLLGVPVAQMIRQHDLSKEEPNLTGYSPTPYTPERVDERIANLGWMNEIMRAIVGRDTNIGERYGPGNDGFFKDFFVDKTASEFTFGLAGTTARDALYSLEPVGMWLMDAIRGRENAYKPTLKDFTGMAGALTGFSDAEKMLVALATGKYYNKRGKYVDDMTAVEAMIMGLTGVTSLDVADLAKIKNIEREKLQLQGRLEPKIKQAMSASLKAFADGDNESGYKQHQNAMALMVWADYDQKQRQGLYKRLIDDSISDVEKARRRMSTKTSAELDKFIKRIEGR